MALEPTPILNIGRKKQTFPSYTCDSRGTTDSVNREIAMEQLPDNIDKIIDSKTVEKVYDDGLSSTIKEISKFGVDAIKTARLILAPLQIAASFQDRFERFLERINKRVPDERMIPIPAELSAPAIENLRYLDETNVLSEMFEELLVQAADSDTVSNVHPSFVHLISQLSRDEAVILYKLRNHEFEVIDRLSLNRAKNRFENRVIEKSTIPTGDLIHPDSMDLYYSHLESLSLVTWPVYKEDPIGTGASQTGTRRHSKMLLTDFGKLFVKACVPEHGFSNIG